MWKPVLSAANHVRIFFMPPNARTATRPSGSRLHGQPQCSSCRSSSGASLTNASTASWSHEPVAARDRVVGVLVEAVVGGDDAGRAALGRDRVAAHRIDLRDHRHVEPGVGLGDRDGGAQARAAAAHDQDVVRGAIDSLTAQLLVHQHLSVVVDDHAVDAAVVELLTGAAAPAGVAQVLGGQTLVVLGRTARRRARLRTVRAAPRTRLSRQSWHLRKLMGRSLELALHSLLPRSLREGKAGGN